MFNTSKKSNEQLIATLMERLEKAEARIADLSTMILETRPRVDILEATTSNLEYQWNELEGRVNDFETHSHDDLESRVDDLENDVRDIETPDTENLVDRVGRFEDEMDDLQKRTQGVEKLREEVSQLTQRIEHTAN